MLTKKTSQARRNVFKLKLLFYFWSFTWGGIQTIIGAIVALCCAFVVPGARIRKDEWFFRVELPNVNWGLECGIFYICGYNSTDYLQLHEMGHQFQNLIFGPLQPFLITIPSVIRFWYREIRARCGKENKIGYYDIWFEKTASELGLNYIKFLNRVDV